MIGKNLILIIGRYGVTVAQMNSFGLHTLMHKYGGLLGLLTRVFPNHNWDSNYPLFSQKVQSLVFSYTKQLFPSQDIHSNYLHPSLVFSQSNELMELDIFVPRLALALEYQGESHYRDGYLFKEEHLKRDKVDIHH